MSLESGDIEGLRSEPVVEASSVDLDLPSTSGDFSDAEIPSNLATATELLDIQEPEEQETEYAAEITSADLTQPDSLKDENDAVSPSTLAEVPERLETKTTEESETEFEAEITKTIIRLLSGFIDAENSSGTVAALEHLENGECKEPKTEEFAVEDDSADINGLDSLADSNDAVTISSKAAVLEHLENGECEEPMTEEPATEVDSADINGPDSLADSSGAVTISFRDAVLEHLDDGECEEPKTEEPKTEKPAAEVASADINVPNSLTDSNDAVTISSKAAVPEHLENGECEEPKTEDPAAEVASAAIDVPASLTDSNDSVTCSYRDVLDSGPEGKTEDLSSSKQLPLEVGKHVIQLQCKSSAPDAPNGVCLVNIVGTAHVSKASCEEVQALIRHVKPQVVFLELCSSRTHILLPRNREVPTFSSMLASYKKKEMNTFGLLYSWFLAKVGDKLEVLPGSEFRVAYEEAVMCGASVTLGDRPIQITLKRTWGNMSIWHKTKFLVGMLTATLSLPSADEFHALMEKMEQSDEFTFMIQELSKAFPTLLETLVVERDLYMVASLRKVASRHSSVVAVVGRGHLSGIANHWKEDISVDKLLALPPKNPLSRKWLWGTLALGVGGIVVGAHLLRQS